MSIVYLILGIALLVGAIILCYKPLMPATLLAYGSMWLFDMGKHITTTRDELTFWGVATMIILVISSSRPQEVENPKGVGYITSGALVGCILGMLTTHAGIILGSAIGAMLGFGAYCRTPQGASIKLPSKEFLSQLAANGLPTIVTLSIIGTVVDSFLLKLVSTN